MDINLARTFLMVAETGSFVETARKMNITQSTVSARIKGLEDMLGRPLFERSKSGAELTDAGGQFQKHALALVRVWQHAQLEINLSATHRDHLSVGAPTTLEFMANSNRNYGVQFRDNLGAGAWFNLTNAFTRPTNRLERVVDPDAGPRRYYRLVTPQQP